MIFVCLLSLCCLPVHDKKYTDQFSLDSRVVLRTSTRPYRYWNVATGSVKLKRKPTIIRKFKGLNSQDGHVSLYIPEKGLVKADHLNQYLTIFDFDEENAIDAEDMAAFTFLENKLDHGEWKTFFTYSTLFSKQLICIGSDSHLILSNDESINSEDCHFQNLYPGEF